MNHAEIIKEWVAKHPEGAAALSKAILNAPLGDVTVYIPLVRSSAPTASQVLSKVIGEEK